MRQPSVHEAALVTQLVAKLDKDAREQVLADLANAKARPASDDGSRIAFDIEGYERPAYRGQHAFGCEARMLDHDNAPLSVVLYADENGRLLELEFIRWEAGDLLAPRFDTLTLI